MNASRRWTILAVGTYAQAASFCLTFGIPMLVPALRADGLTLFQTGLVISAPVAGSLLTLIAWGAAADRYGERIVMLTGLVVATGLLVIAASVHGAGPLAVALLFAGAAGASVNAASGRVVMGWFPAHERGLAMGTRQTSQPLGVAVAAVALPPLAHAYGAHHALLFPATLCATAALLVLTLVRDPARVVRADGDAGAASPYRGSSQLARVHFTSSLLVVPQFAVAIFTLTYLVEQRHWNATHAGQLVFAFAFAGAIGRVVSGVWSDRVGSRLRPIRQLAVAAALLMAGLSLGAAVHASWIVVVFGIAAVITVADNGLAYIAVAELAGAQWAGRALGVQNTVQGVAAVATAPLLSAIIGDNRYALGFALAAVFPLMAVAVVPVRAEASHHQTVEAEHVVLDRRDVDA